LLVVSADSFNRSRITTVIAAVITSNVQLAEAPGNVRCGGRGTGLTKSSVVNVSQLITVDRSLLTAKAGRLASSQLGMVEQGLRMVLGLR
jgi:mRNA interferase MazF